MALEHALRRAESELRRQAKSVLRAFGYDLVRARAVSVVPLPPDFDDKTCDIVRAVAPYTLTTPERIFMLCQAVRYLVQAGVPGAFVECGVWRGGSSLAMILALLDLGVTDRDVYMFDTFEQMPSPGPEDIDIMGVPAAQHHATLAAGGDYDHAYDYLPFESVRSLLEGTGYPEHHLHFVRGVVEETIPAEAPDEIALLRLDTDYYSSTKHELEHLVERMPARAVLLIDDYGHFQGCRKATDEVLARLAQAGRHLMLNRIDYSARIATVPAV